VAWFNYHTHTNYCDGTEAPEKYLFEALDLKMSAIGFSAHAPLALKNEWCIPLEKLEEYCQHINKLKREYEGQIQIYLGLEMDYIPGITKDFEILKQQHNLDYIIGSVHLVKKEEVAECWFIDGPEAGYERGLKLIFLQNSQEAVTTFYRQSAQMVETQKPDVVAHMDKVKMYNRSRFFDEEEKWYKDSVIEFLEVVKLNGTIIEVNTRGLYKQKVNKLYPENWIIKKCREMGIPLTLSSDSHRPSELIACFSDAAAIMKDAGVKEILMFENGSWHTVGFSRKGLIR
jgi:histidinol-phosphatase (PHP family)